jgi:predicted nucleic acid-binding protein
MIWVDTNVVLRLITGDVPELAQQAAERIAEATDDLIVPDYVFAEAATVLEFNSHYRWSRAHIVAGLEDISAMSHLKIDPEVAQAIVLYKSHPKLDFVDCLLATAANHQRTHIMTFDKDLLKIMK